MAKKKNENNKKLDSKTILRSKIDAVLEAVKKTCPSEWSTDDPIVTLRAKQISCIETCKTGSLKLDSVLGGGYAFGRIVEIYGPESSGKSTLTLHVIANVQRDYPDDMCALIDSENSFDPIYARALGIDIENLLVSQPDSGEHALNILVELIKNNVKLIIVDSVAALTPRDMFENKIGDVTVGKHAKMMSEGLRNINTLLSKKKSCVIFTNQTRELIGQAHASMGGSTTGGKALRFYASQRLEVRRTGSETDKDNVPINNIVSVKVAKNKIAAPFQTATFKIRFGKGIDPIEQAIDFGIDYDFIEKSGAWFVLKLTGEKFQGKEKLYQILSSNDELFDTLNNAILAEFNKRKAEAEALEAKESAKKISRKASGSSAVEPEVEPETETEVEAKVIEGTEDTSVEELEDFNEEEADMSSENDEESSDIGEV